MLNQPPILIDLVAEATWIACCHDSMAEAEMFAAAANQWVDGHPFQLTDCPFEEHLPEKVFWVNFEPEQYDERWACYCHCAWVLHSRFPSVQAAVEEAEKYFDKEGVSSLFLEWLVFGSDYPSDVLPDGRPLYVFDPELRILVAYNRDVTEYSVTGGHGAIVVEKIGSRDFHVAE